MFEIGKRDGRGLLAGTPNRIEGRLQVVISHHSAIDADALVVVQQVRRSEQAGPLAMGAKDGFRHSRDGTLAVGAAHGKHGARRRGHAQPLQHTAQTLKREIHRERMDLLVEGQPAFHRLRRRHLQAAVSVGSAG